MCYIVQSVAYFWLKDEFPSSEQGQSSLSRQSFIIEYVGGGTLLFSCLYAMALKRQPTGPDNCFLTACDDRPGVGHL